MVEVARSGSPLPEVDGQLQEHVRSSRPGGGAEAVASTSGSEVVATIGSFGVSGIVVVDRIVAGVTGHRGTRTTVADAVVDAAVSRHFSFMT